MGHFTIIRDILRFVAGGKRKKTLDTPNARKKLEQQNIKYKAARQEYDTKSKQMKIEDKED